MIKGYKSSFLSQPVPRGRAVLPMRGRTLGGKTWGKWWTSVLICSDCHTKYHKLSSLNDSKLIFSQFWRLDVQDQGVSRVGFFWVLYLLLIDGYLASVTSRGLFSVCSYGLVSLFYKDTSHLRLGSILLTLFQLNTLPPNMVLGVRTSI